MRKGNNAANSAWAIKIGGSLYNSKYLVPWLHTISEISDMQIVIVPGGGPFADQVRHADDKFNLAEARSHNMAVLAMQQYGNVFASLCSELVLANSEDKINQVWADKKVAIWEPYEMVRDQCELAKSWQVTSDSIALWLSNVLDIENLLLVKASKQVLEEVSIGKLAKEIT